MNPHHWQQVDDYFGGLFAPAGGVLEHVLRSSDAAGLPQIQVSPLQGKLLMLLALAQRAQRVLEIGTLGGYSTLWLARAVAPTGGRIITLEIDETHATVARENFRRAGVHDCIDLRLGPALETLPRLEAEKAGPFDLVFIDADKPAAPDYFTWALRLTRPGSTIIVDNVVRDGAVADPANTDPSVRGIRRCLEMMASDPRVAASALQTVGVKGYDGFAMAVVTS